MKLSSQSLSIVQVHLEFEGCFELHDGETCVGDITYLQVPGKRAVIDSVWLQVMRWAELAGLTLEVGSRRVQELVDRVPVARQALAA